MTIGIIAAVLLAVLAIVFVISSLARTSGGPTAIRADYLPIVMFLTLAILLFSGYPVAFVLGGIALFFGLIGYAARRVLADRCSSTSLPRIWGQAAENLILVAVPTFIFMGTVIERSGIANDLLYPCRCCSKRVPGALAIVGHADGNHHGRDHRHRRRLGGHADRAGAAGDDAAGYRRSSPPAPSPPPARSAS